MENEIKTVTYRIIRLLKEYPATRNCDKLLAELYYKHFENKHIPLTQASTNPDTISRCRRKIQSKNPLMRAKDEVETARAEKEHQYKNIFVNVDNGSGLSLPY